MLWIESILLKAYMWASRPNWSLHPMPQISHLNTPNSLSSPLPSIFFCKYFVETLITDICLSCLVFLTVEVHLHVLGTRAENLANITEETGTLVGFLCLHLQKRWKISQIFSFLGSHLLCVRLPPIMHFKGTPVLSDKAAQGAIEGADHRFFLVELAILFG